jgi:hypothetical protein
MAKTKVDEREVKNLVTIKPVETVKGKPRILSGARRTLAPFFGFAGELITGVSREDAKRIGDELGVTIDRAFWTNFAVILTDKPKTFDTSDPFCELQVLFLKAHPEVANSMNDIVNETSYVIYDEVEEAKKENKKFESVLNAYAYIKEMTITERAEFLTLFGVKTENLADEVIMKKLKEKADNNSVLFCDMFEDKNREMKVFIAKLVRYEVLRKNGEALFYGDLMLGGNMELAIEFLKNTDHQETLVGLKKVLKEKSKV